MNDTEKEKSTVESEEYLSANDAAENTAGQDQDKEQPVGVSDLLERIAGLEQRIVELTAAHETHRDRLDHAYDVLGIPPKTENAPTFKSEKIELAHLKEEEAVLVAQERSLTEKLDMSATPKDTAMPINAKVGGTPPEVERLPEKTEALTPERQNELNTRRAEMDNRIAKLISDYQKVMREDRRSGWFEIKNRDTVVWRLNYGQAEEAVREHSRDYLNGKTDIFPFKYLWFDHGITSALDLLKGRPYVFTRLDLHIDDKVFPFLSKEDEFARAASIQESQKDKKRAHEAYIRARDDWRKHGD